MAAERCSTCYNVTNTVSQGLNWAASMGRKISTHNRHAGLAPAVMHGTCHVQTAMLVDPVPSAPLYLFVCNTVAAADADALARVGRMPHKATLDCPWLATTVSRNAIINHAPQPSEACPTLLVSSVTYNALHTVLAIQPPAVPLHARLSTKFLVTPAPLLGTASVTVCDT